MSTDPTVMIAITALGGYLLGSVPFGLVLTRMAGLGDIRDIGSHSIGATNVLRTGNKPLAFLTLIMDGGKGGIAVALGLYLSGSFEISLIAGTLAVFGHNYPIWLKFKGGKGMATTIGIIFVASWPIGVAVGLCWLAMAAIFRYSSFASIVCLSLAPVFSWFIVPEPDRMAMVLATGLLGVLSLIRHHENISRLLKGTESKIGAKKK